jgi:RNA 3'-terminal phosphate cyclase (ATP)
VKAAVEICAGVADGAELGSRALTFRPGKLAAGDYSFAIGTAGSCTLVLQTVLPPLLVAPAASRVRITGGTHNRASPPFDFLSRSFLPLLARMGAAVDLQLASYGFFPRGGGEIRARIQPAGRLAPLSLTARGSFVAGLAEAYIAAVPLHVAQRELEVIGKALGWTPEQLHVRGLPNDVGPGNAVTISIEHEHVTEVFTGFGEKGTPAEKVAEGAAHEARAHLVSTAPVGAHLADQLLLPMALAGGGEFLAAEATPHLRSNAAVVERFTSRRVSIVTRNDGCLVTLR